MDIFEQEYVIDHEPEIDDTKVNVSEIVIDKQKTKSRRKDIKQRKKGPKKLRERKKRSPRVKTENVKPAKRQRKQRAASVVHMKQIHPNEKNIFYCTECSKRYSSWSSFRCHTKTHLPDHLRLIYQCQFCDKRFSQLCNVQTHTRAVHENDRPYICETCGKCFINNGALKEHQVVHSDKHPFQCDKCDKKFKLRQLLQRHQEYHAGVAHTCPHCGIKLSTKITLRRHLLVHSDVKKFECKYCDRKFKRSKSLKVHLILHTGLKPYECPFCYKSFSNGANFKSHKKKSHPVELAALEATEGSLPTANLPRLDELR